MAIYESAHRLTHGMEGGEVDDPDDRGGHTIYGVTKKVFKRYKKTTGYKGDFSALTPEIAREVGKTLYWDRMRGDHFHSQCVANEVYDACFHHGVKGGVKLLQKSINKFYHCPQYKMKTKLKADGVMGEITLAAVNDITRRYEVQFYKCINGMRFKKMDRICLFRPSQWKYFIGWMWRC